MEIVLSAGFGFAGGVAGYLLAELMRRFVRGCVGRRGIGSGEVVRMRSSDPDEVRFARENPDWTIRPGYLVSPSGEGEGRRGKQTRTQRTTNTSLKTAIESAGVASGPLTSTLPADPNRELADRMVEDCKREAETYEERVKRLARERKGRYLEKLRSDPERYQRYLESERERRRKARKR